MQKNRSNKKQEQQKRPSSKRKRSNNRPKICRAALALFNELGVEKTSVNKIASMAKVSPGNLRHNFKTKDHIIVELLQQLQRKLERIAPKPNEKADLQRLHTYIHESFALLLRYKFLMIDVVSLVRDGELLQNGFAQLAQVRVPVIMQLFDRLAQQGYFRTDYSPGHYQILLRQFIAFANFWISESEVFYTGRPEKKVDYYARMSFDLFFPYLTNKGLEEYKKLE